MEQGFLPGSMVPECNSSAKSERWVQTVSIFALVILVQMHWHVLICIGLLVFTRRWKESWLRPSLPAVTVKAEGLRLMIDALRI